MRKFLALGVLFSCLWALSGMGELGGGPVPADKIPAPEKDFAAGVVDRQGVQTLLHGFSFEGKIFIAGKHGSATVTVPFEKIAEIQFQGQEGNEVGARISLRDQESILIKMEKRSRFFGKTDFGTFQVEAKDLKSIRFSH